MKQKKAREKRLLLLAIIALIVAGFLLERFDIVIFTDTEKVRSFVSSFGILAPLVYILLMTAAIIIVPLPNFIVGLVAAFLFPWYLATLYTLMADFAGSTIVFYLSRYFGRPLIERFVKDDKLKQIDDLAHRLGVKTVFILRLVPGFSFDLVGYVAGLTSISYTAYILATILGVLPRRFLTYYLIDKSIQIDPLVVIIGILLSMLTVPIIAYWYWQKKRGLYKS